MNFLQKLKVSNRVFLVFGVVIALYVINIAFNTLSLNNIKGNVSAIYNNWLVSTNYLLQSDRDGYQARLAFSEALSNYDSSRFDLIESLEGSFADVDENLGQLNSRFQDFKKIYVEATGNDLKQFKSFDSEYKKLLTASEGIKQSLFQNNLGTAEYIYANDFAHSFDVLRTAIDEVTEISEKEASAQYAESIERSNGIQTATFSFFGVIFTLMVLMGLLLTRSIVIQLGCEPSEAAEIATRLAHGDLTYSFDSRNKGLYADLKLMVNKLKETLSEVISSTRNLSSSSEQLSEISIDISSEASEQAASAEEINSSMEVMTDSIQQNSKNATETETIAEKTHQSVNEAYASVTDTVSSMNTIAEKITVIGEIARQTNILALNAAVEAARAGEHGKGFAVVAAEVRRLAEHSSKAAAEIDELSKNSVSVATQSGHLLGELVPEIEKTTNLVKSISAGSLEQTESTKQVNMAIEQLNQVIQNNSVRSEEMASGSEELTAQAESLKQLVSFFKIDTDESIDQGNKSTANVNGFSNGVSKNGSNGYSNGHSNGSHNGHAVSGHALNGSTNGHVNGHSNGSANGHVNGKNGITLDLSGEEEVLDTDFEKY